MHFFSIGIRSFLAAAFVIFCLIQAKRIGVAGAIALAVIALLDVSIVLAYFVLDLAEVHSTPLYTGLDLLNVLFNLVSTALVIVAMISLRSRSSVRG